MGYALTKVREFRYEYDDPRERYLEADRNCSTGAILETRWSDYLGGSIYADFVVTAGGQGQPVYENKIAFLPGIAVVDPHGGNATVPKYYHTDHLGTTRSMSNSDGDDEPGTPGGIVYTAFGEPINDSTQRYGYVGAYGYRAHDDMACAEESTAYAFPYLHVGWRYYDPASGRFIQRDPIGLAGGVNVYEYVRSRPVARIDPQGLDGFGECGWMRPFPPRPDNRTPAEELQDIKHQKLLLKGGFACAGILTAPVSVPVTVGIGIGLIIVEIIDNW